MARYRRYYRKDLSGLILLVLIGLMSWFASTFNQHPVLTTIVIVSIVSITGYIIYFFKKKKTIKNEFNKGNVGICPLCGSQLVAKQGKYGPFIGCSNFPQCRYIQNK